MALVLDLSTHHRLFALRYPISVTKYVIRIFEVIAVDRVLSQSFKKNRYFSNYSIYSMIAKFLYFQFMYTLLHPYLNKLVSVKYYAHRHS